MMDEILKFADLTSIIVDCAIRVHSNFGMGFSENIYQKSLILEFENAGLKSQTEVDRSVFYLGKLVGKRRLDLIVENKILVALKTLSTGIDKSCYNQILNYLKIFGLEVGLLINFGKESFEFKKLIYSDKVSENSF